MNIKNIIFLVSIFGVGRVWGTDERPVVKWKDLGDVTQFIIVKNRNSTSEVCEKEFNESQIRDISNFENFVNKGQQKYKVEWDGTKFKLIKREDLDKNKEHKKEQQKISEKTSGTGSFVNNNQLFIFERRKECFKFYLESDAILLLQGSTLELDNFKFDRSCYIPLKNSESKFMGYILFKKMKNDREFRMNYYSEQQLKGNNNIFNDCDKRDLFIQQSEIEGKKKFVLLEEPPFAFNAIDQKDDVFKGRNLRQFREAREKSKQRNLRKKNKKKKQLEIALQSDENKNEYHHKMLKENIINKTDFDDLKIFLALNATNKNFEPLFLEKVSSYNKTELTKLHNQLSQWDKKIEPDYKGSSMYIYKNMYKKARSLVKLEILKQSSFEKINSFFPKNSEKNDIFKKIETESTKKILNTFHTKLISV